MEKEEDVTADEADVALAGLMKESPVAVEADADEGVHELA